MPAPTSLRSPNGRQILYFIATTLTGPVISKRVRVVPVPQNPQKIVTNVITREEKITLIGTFVENALSGEETGYVDEASQAAAESATPTGTGLEQLEKLEEWTRSWETQAGARTRGASAYPTAGGTTTTGEITLIIGTKSNGNPWEYQGTIENITPTWTPEKADQVNNVYRFTLTFTIGTAQSA